MRRDQGDDRARPEAHARHRGRAGRGRGRAAGEVGVAAPPVLWHLKISHFNEKARWALDYKGVAHVRRAPMPGMHPLHAYRLTRGKTFPVLVLDGQAIGDSTRIIEELERRYPEPPLYPADPDERARALELEDLFDEELGPIVRRLAMHAVADDPQLALDTFVQRDDRAVRWIGPVMFPLVRAINSRRYGVSDGQIAASWERLEELLTRFKAELQPSGYLVGDGFTVADLSFAAFLGPVLAPHEYPYPPPQDRVPPVVEKLRAMADRAGAGEWVRDIYARHRGTSAEIAT